MAASLNEFLSILSLVSTVTSGVLWYANKTLREEILDIKKEIDQQVATELIVLTSRFQRNIDNNKINNGLLKVRVTDLERWAKLNFDYAIRAEFPTDALPGDRTEL